jgi:hypothetical protein
MDKSRHPMTALLAVSIFGAISSTTLPVKANTLYCNFPNDRVVCQSVGEQKLPPAIRERLRRVRENARLRATNPSPAPQPPPGGTYPSPSRVDRPAPAPGASPGGACARYPSLC